MKRLCFLATVIAASALFMAGDNPPPPPDLAPIADDFETLMAETPLVYADGEPDHFEGQFLMIVGHGFELSTLAALDPSIELIYDRPTLSFPNIRRILARAAEEIVDRIVADLRSMPDVIEAGRNSVAVIQYQPDDRSWSQQHLAGLGLLYLPLAWDRSMGAPATVAVIDTGVDPIVELQGRLLPGINATAFVDDGDTSDSGGHGTMVASVVAAMTNPGDGIAGIAPAASVVPIRACTPHIIGGAICPSVYVETALDWILSRVLAGDNIQVVNMSFSGDDAITYSAFLRSLTSRGVILVSAAGNDGEGNVQSPARVGEVVAVSGVTRSGSARHPGSNYGQDLDVAAPYEAYAVTRDNTTQLVGGTSFSAAIISGVAALWQSTRPQLGIQENVTGDFLDGIDASNPGGWDNQTGRGVPNAYLTIWRSACQRKDVRRDNRIDGYDEQTIAYYWGLLRHPALRRRRLRSHLRPPSVPVARRPHRYHRPAERLRPRRRHLPGVRRRPGAMRSTALQSD